jgi:hypothetical protein
MWHLWINSGAGTQASYHAAFSLLYRKFERQIIKDAFFSRVKQHAGNTNFFYFLALIFNFANCFIVMDFISVTVKRIRERNGRRNALPLSYSNCDASCQTSS